LNVGETNMNNALLVNPIEHIVFCNIKI
jgi:hypothetical protein